MASFPSSSSNGFASSLDSRTASSAPISSLGRRRVVSSHSVLPPALDLHTIRELYERRGDVLSATASSMTFAISADPRRRLRHANLRRELEDVFGDLTLDRLDKRVRSRRSISTTRIRTHAPGSRNSSTTIPGLAATAPRLGGRLHLHERRANVFPISGRLHRRRSIRYQPEYVRARVADNTLHPSR